MFNGKNKFIHKIFIWNKIAFIIVYKITAMITLKKAFRCTICENVWEVIQSVDSTI